MVFDEDMTTTPSTDDGAVKTPDQGDSDAGNPSTSPAEAPAEVSDAPVE
jgi:hypothetical protein